MKTCTSVYHRSSIVLYDKVDNGLSGDFSDDLSSEECLLLYQNFNVKFSETNSGKFAFIGSKVGLCGLGATHLEAFIRLLSLLEYKRNTERSLEVDLKAFLIPLPHCD